MKLVKFLFLFLFLSFSTLANAILSVGVEKTEITPPIGTPSAGYVARNGKGMSGVHDPLLAIAMVIKNEQKTIAFCSVDNLGFTYEMTQKINKQIQKYPGLESCDVYIGSSHTHSGSGAFLNIPLVGALLAGPYNEEITEQLLGRVVEIIIDAYENLEPAKLGIGYGDSEQISQYRSEWPANISPPSKVTIIKATRLDDSPLAVLFNYPLHPTILDGSNFLFSADFVGFTREHIRVLIGDKVEAIYFNGAQAEIIPRVSASTFDQCDLIGSSLAQTVFNIWKDTETSSEVTLETESLRYSFVPAPTPYGIKIPLDIYETEINLIVFNGKDAFVTIPGELSCAYEMRLKEKSKALGFAHLSILGLVNDAHGYIILPEAWRRKTKESYLSFGGENYGNVIEKHAHTILEVIKK